MPNVRVAVDSRNEMLDTFDDKCNEGTAAAIQIYTGTQPVNSDTALSGNTLLASLISSTLMWGTASAGVLTLNSVADDSSADNTGTATFARISTQIGGATVFDCDVGTSGTTIILNTTSIVSGGTVSITSGSMTFPGS